MIFKTHRPIILALTALLACPLAASAAEGKNYDLTARASEIDKRAKAHPEIGFLLEKDGKPQDVQHASVDTRVPSSGKLVIWLMGYNKELFDHLDSYGMHSIQVHYAREWFWQALLRRASEGRSVSLEHPSGSRHRGKRQQGRGHS